MRHVRLVALAWALFVAAASTALSSDVVPARLSLTDAVNLALDANVDIKGARADQLTAYSRLKMAQFRTTYSAGVDTSYDKTPEETGMSSSIFGSATYADLSGTQASLDISPIVTGSERSSVGFTLRRPLTKRKGLLSEKADDVLTARSDTAIMDKEMFRTEQSTVLVVIEAYYRAVQAQEQVKIQEKALQLVEQAASDARKREEAQIGLGIDVYRAEVQVAQTRERLNVQRESAKAAVDRLMLAMGAGVGQTPELTDAVPDAKPEAPDLSEAIKTALANRVELSMYDERLVTQQRRLAIAKDELRPGVDLVTRYRSSNPYEGSVSGSTFELGSTTVALEMRVPLDMRVLKEEREIAERDLSILGEQRTFQEQQIADDVRSAYRSLESTATSLDILKQNLEVAQENLRIAERMVEEGEGDNRDVLSAQQSLTGAESGIIAAKTELYLALMELRYAIGEDLTATESR